jgi:uncharacterized protein (TIGR02271 family)
LLGEDEINRVNGQDVYDTDGDKIGTAGQVYVDDETGKPEWVTVRTGLFGSRESFVPLADASVTDDRVTVPYSKAFVEDAPNLDDDGHLSPEEERQLYAYYGRGDDTSETGQGVAGVDDDRSRSAAGGFGDTGGRRADVDDSRRGVADTEGTDVSGQSTDDAMTVSEERLNVGTERREAGRARLRKYVVTENVTQTVPVQREEVRVEREPITDANAGDALSGPEISEEEHEVVLHEERPVVDTEAVPVERVRLDTETVTEQETVGGEVRKERVDVDDSSVSRERT